MSVWIFTWRNTDICLKELSCCRNSVVALSRITGDVRTDCDPDVGLYCMTMR